MTLQGTGGTGAAVVDPSAAIRAKLVTLMDGTVTNHRNWIYKAVRPLPMPTLTQALHGQVVSDCSHGVAVLCKLANAKDPTKANWQGNSTSMFLAAKADGWIIPLTKVQPGDYGVLGAEGRLHAFMFRTAGKSPTVWSDGSSFDPAIVTLAAEVQWHAQHFSDGGVLTCIRLPI